MISTRLIICALLGSFAGTVVAQNQEAESEAFEAPPQFETQQFLSPEVLEGSHHQVRETATSDGFLINFTVDSDFSTFECAGFRDLLRCIQEINAIARLVEVSKSELFADGVKKSIESPIESVKNFVSQPGKTVERIPQAVGSLVGQVGQSIRNIGDGESDTESRDDVTPRKTITRSLAGIAGFDRAKRETARQLGVDPYSSNLRLQQEMEKVTWPFFAGGLPFQLGVRVVSGGASLALSASQIVELPEDIYDVSASEIALRDRRMMESMGVEEETADALINNSALSVSMRHSMLITLGELSEAPGKETVIKLISDTRTAPQTHFLNDVLRLMARRSKTQPYSRYGIYGNLPAGLTEDGFMEVCTPVDYIAWTARVADFSAFESWSSSRKRMILDGNLSPLAAQNFSAGNWEVLKIEPNPPAP